MKGRVRRSCWCGGKRARVRARFRFGADRFTLVRCERCGVEALHPTPPPGVLAKYYATEYYGASPKKFIGPIARLVAWFQEGRARMVARAIPAGGRVLDIGCGNGGFLGQMRARGFAVEGTEWTRESAARVAGGITVHVGDLLELDLPRGSYDAITLWHVFEHLAQPEETLRRIHGLLRPGGVLFLSMPNHESWQAALCGAGWFHLDPPRHLHGFGVRSLGALLRRCEFRVGSRHTWSMEQNPYGVIQGVLNNFFTPRDRAYGVLKGTSRAPVRQRLLDLFLVGVLTPAALAFSIIESMAGRGGTMTVVAERKRERG